MGHRKVVVERAGAHRAPVAWRGRLADATAAFVSLVVITGAVLGALWFVQVGDASARTVVGTVVGGTVSPASPQREADAGPR